MSQFVLGIGNTLYYSLGQSYLDDNTKQHNTPLMLAYAFSMRMFGPVIGFGLAYAMLRIYIDPTLTPVIAKDDPRWLGAWWLGWLLLGALMFVFAGLIGLFPKHLPKKKKVIEYEIDGEKSEPKVETVEKVVIKERKDGELKGSELCFKTQSVYRIRLTYFLRRQNSNLFPTMIFVSFFIYK